MVNLDANLYVDHVLMGTERKFDYRKVLQSDEWATWQHDFREEIQRILGLPSLLKVGSQLDLGPETVEESDYDTFRLEKVYITAEPSVKLPFYLLLPKHRKPPFPLVLTPHGHERRGKEVSVGRYVDEAEERRALAHECDIALQAVHEGYAVIAPDVRGFWEMSRREDLEHNQNNSCSELQRRALMLGRTLIGERVYDIGRLIDYATTRPEIDTTQIVITGNSGGGTVALFAAACDNRITLAVPASYFCTFKDSILSISHCSCNVVPGIMQLGEMYDVAGLIAPRPVLMVHGEQDPIYPVQGTLEAFQHLQAIYRAMGVENHCELYIGSEGHRYYKKRVWPFIREHLKSHKVIID